MRLDDSGTALRLGEDELLYFDCLTVGRYLWKRALHLRTKPHDIGAPHTGVEQEIKGQSCLRADRMAGLIASRIGVGPCPNSVGIAAAQSTDITCRVLFGITIFGRSRPGEQLAQCLDTVIGGVRKGGLFIAQLGNVGGLHRRIPKIAGALANLFQDRATDLAGARSEQLEYGRRVVLLAQPTHSPGRRDSVLVSRPLLPRNASWYSL